MPKSKIIFIDLSTDSYIDSEFKVQGIETPIEWLQNNQDLKKYIAKSSMPNVKVVSTGLAFFNNLYLLEADWKKLLGDIDTLGADVVILYVGCLNDVVTRVLFQSFAGIMRSRLVVNATPINLRTTILTLAGMNNTESTKVCCANFDTASKVVYTKLAEKYDTEIIHGETVMTL